MVLESRPWLASLGTLGHPVIAQPAHWEGKGRGQRKLVHDPPYVRTFGQLRAYCGVADPKKKRRKGQEAEEVGESGSPRLHTLLYLMAVSCVKKRESPYRRVYNEAREVYATRVSTDDDKWTDLRRHNAALRKVSKDILRDLWEASRDA